MTSEQKQVKRESILSMILVGVPLLVFWFIFGYLGFIYEHLNPIVQLLIVIPCAVSISTGVILSFLGLMEND